VARGAAAAAELLASVGGRARLVDTGGHPLVVGELPGPRGAPVLTLYNHLDVQPADRAAEGWRTDPFRMQTRNGRYFGRGTTDDKGPALAALFGAVAARQAGVPVTVKLLWETEEEIGSPHFERALSRLGARARTGAVVVSDSSWLSRRTPTTTAGLRGFQGFLFRLETAEVDAHSGIVGGAARNPLAELMDLSAALFDARTGRVKVPGFYDGIAPLTRRERDDFRRSGFSLRAFRRDNRVRRLRSHHRLDLMERVWARPTFEIHGLAGGYQGPGLKSVVPARAELKASCRLVPGQDPDRIAARSLGAHRSPRPRRQGCGPVRLRARAEVRPLRRHDRGREQHAAGARVPGRLPGPVAARPRLPRAQRELRVGPGRGRDRGIRPARRGVGDGRAIISSRCERTGRASRWWEPARPA
jgi:acetylornithine deacetylase/succinyl-diaminopimelate desuccinylase-like protein